MADYLHQLRGEVDSSALQIKIDRQKISFNDLSTFVCTESKQRERQDQKDLVYLHFETKTDSFSVNVVGGCNGWLITYGGGMVKANR